MFINGYNFPFKRGNCIEREVIVLIPELFIGAPRPFGQSAEKYSYEKGTAFHNAENQGIEFKALTQEKPQKLPWKIMEKARLFICGVLNAGGQGIIYFGIGDSCDDKTDFIHGEIIGLGVESLKDEISKAFQSILDDHIKSDNGKMTRGGDMNCVNLRFVPVTSEMNQNTGSYVVEIEVKREWKFCKDQVYYVEEWRKKADDKSKLQFSIDASLICSTSYWLNCFYTNCQLMHEENI